MYCNIWASSVNFSGNVWQEARLHISLDTLRDCCFPFLTCIIVRFSTGFDIHLLQVHSMSLREQMWWDRDVNKWMMNCWSQWELQWLSRTLNASIQLSLPNSHCGMDWEDGVGRAIGFPTAFVVARARRGGRAIALTLGYDSSSLSCSSLFSTRIILFGYLDVLLISSWVFTSQPRLTFCLGI